MSIYIHIYIRMYVYTYVYIHIGTQVVLPCRSGRALREAWLHAGQMDARRRT